MPNLYNVISNNLNINTKKIMSKLSFETGEAFTARIVNLDKITGELTLKLLDGWQFQAKMDKCTGFPNSGLNRFVVEGFDQGKLKIKIVNGKAQGNSKSDNTIVNTLKEQKIDISKEDYKLLEKMIRHSMPLTKDNISFVKSIIDFKTTIQEEPEKKEIFINKFLESKGVEVNSPKGILYRDKLRVFFESIATISDNDILTLMENDLELNHENIKSFNHVFKDSKVIYKELINFSKEINKTVPSKNSEIKTLEPEQQEKVIRVQNSRIDILSNRFKEEVIIKTEEIKIIAKELIAIIKTTESSDVKYEKIMSFLGNNVNDFKVFNTVSNQYYYLDLPVKIENFDYDCKLIIKDERKKEKKIDSNDVKIAASIKTKNMGTVDSYITVKNNNMNIDIKSDKTFINILSSGSEILMKELSELRYNVSIVVNQIDKPFNIVESREFFQDNELRNIDVIV